jgi:hypothetical protein
MRFRKLRITFSATCLIACMLLIVLWVRSYWVFNTVQYLAAGSQGYGIVSDRGRLTIDKFDLPQNRVNRYYNDSRWFVRHESTGEWPPASNWRIVDQASPYRATKVTVPYWFPLLLAAAISAIALRIPRPRRFSLRTLLIATMLVALLLGAIAYAVR